MNSFEEIGSAQLLAYEGQRQIAAALARVVGQAFIRALDVLGRYLPEGNYAPW